jgi:hypothetical protein
MYRHKVYIRVVTPDDFAFGHKADMSWHTVAYVFTAVLHVRPKRCRSQSRSGLVPQGCSKAGLQATPCRQCTELPALPICQCYRRTENRHSRSITLTALPVFSSKSAQSSDKSTS